MCACIMAVVQIDLCFELVVCRACKEVHAAIECKELVAHFCNRSVWDVYEYIIIAFAAGERF